MKIINNNGNFEHDDWHCPDFDIDIEKGDKHFKFWQNAIKKEGLTYISILHSLNGYNVAICVGGVLDYKIKNKTVSQIVYEIKKDVEIFAKREGLNI